jgi:hypothetical protein
VTAAAIRWEILRIVPEGKALGVSSLDASQYGSAHDTSYMHAPLKKYSRDQMRKRALDTHVMAVEAFKTSWSSPRGAPAGRTRSPSTSATKKSEYNKSGSSVVLYRTHAVSKAQAGTVNQEEPTLPECLVIIKPHLH